ncbi:MAG TPA: isochorismatase family protein [Streptosporangiaceae bacterium]|nr:isochorismatase family protein [Streptosporangiaceae bacterium]
MEEPARLVLAGVSTDCCVLSTAVAAADDGVAVTVVAAGRSAIWPGPGWRPRESTSCNRRSRAPTPASW